MDEIGRNGFKKIILLNAHGGIITSSVFWDSAACGSRSPIRLHLRWRAARGARRNGGAAETEEHGTPAV
jgi:creatinine amidohydrolase/Fe(II)-dependent formamide hydrolase-like protein